MLLAQRFEHKRCQKIRLFELFEPDTLNVLFRSFTSPSQSFLSSNSNKSNFKFYLRCRCGMHNRILIAVYFTFLGEHDVSAIELLDSNSKEFAMPPMKWVVVLSVMTICSSADGEVCPMNAYAKEAKFVAVKHTSGEALCATDAPGLAYTPVRSKISCTLLCQENSDCCAGVNWKEPRTCEIFPVMPSNFLTIPGCSYFQFFNHPWMFIFQRR